MNELLILALHNSIVAVLLAIVVYGWSCLVRCPPLTHLLWLIVLLKLVAPPVITHHWAVPNPGLMEYAVVEPAAVAGDVVMAAETVAPTLHAKAPHQPHAPSVAVVDWLSGFLMLAWVGGIVVYAVITIKRVIRFDRLLRGTLVASESTQQLANDVARQFGLRRVPEVRYADSIQIPMLWCIGRPLVVLPMQLQRRLDEEQIVMILAHELAHYRRRDHVVRIIEMLISIVYWWNPLVRVIRRQLHQAEDLCCDGWVRQTMPDCSKRYAEVVLKAAESIGATRFRRGLLPASPFLHTPKLKERIEMILQSRFRPQVSVKSLIFTAAFACLVLPAFFATGPASAAPDDDAARPGEHSSATESAFPFVVDFEQGATNFDDGDSITILEVRGTAKTFQPGNIYWIRGTYRLQSRPKALLAAYTTATEGDGISMPYKVQHKNIEKGKGTFKLFLPMNYKGLPHVSFYDGEGFGGNYFGTGDSVLRRWWGSKEK